MNARQKAKHFKRLYEALGATKINPNIIAGPELKHYKAEFIMPNREVFELGLNFKENLEELITGKLLSNLEPVIKDCIVSERDQYIDATRFSIDIWLKNDSFENGLSDYYSGKKTLNQIRAEEGLDPIEPLYTKVIRK